MVSAIVAFSRNNGHRRNPDDDDLSNEGSERLLSSDQKASSYRHNKTTKKKSGGLFGLFKRKQHNPEDDYEPPTAPSSPAEGPPNVTVLTPKFDPANPYGVSRADTTISDLTPHVGSPHRRVGFDPSTKVEVGQLTPVRSTAGPPQDGQGESQQSTPSTYANSDGFSDDGGQAQTFEDTTNSGTEQLTISTAPNIPTNRCGDDGAGDVLSRTLGLFDDICQVSMTPNKNLEPQLAAAMNGRAGGVGGMPVSAVPNSNRDAATRGSAGNSSSGRHEWGMSPSDDDDDDTFLHSMETTLEGSSISLDQTNSLQTNSIQTTSDPALPPSNAPTFTKIPLGDGRSDAEEPKVAEEPTHENFEVVLEASFMHQTEPTPKRRGWFSSKNVVANVTTTSTVSPSVVVDSPDKTSPPNAESTTLSGAAPSNSSSKPPLLAKRWSTTPTDGDSTTSPRNGTPRDEEEGLELRQIGSDEDECWDTDASDGLHGADLLHADDERAIKPATQRQPWNTMLNTNTLDRAVVKSEVNFDTTNTEMMDGAGNVGPKTDEARTDVPAEGVKANTKNNEKKVNSTAEEPKMLKGKMDATGPTVGTAREEQKGKKTPGLVVVNKKPSTSGHKRHSSLGNIFSKLAAPVRRKRSKDDSDVKYGSSKNKKLPQKVESAKPVKPSWKAVVDPNTGRTYYYHRKTRETTWTKPAELVRAEKEAARAAKQSEDQKRRQSKATGSASLTKSAPSTLVQNATAARELSTPPRVIASGSVPASAAASEMTEVSSPLKPPSVVEAELTVESQQRIDKAEMGRLDESFNENGIESPQHNSEFDDNWVTKKEINRLLTCLQPPDKASVNELMTEYEGNEEQLLKRLRDLVESQPFDEPFLDEPAFGEDVLTANHSAPIATPQRPGSSLNNRSRTSVTAASRNSATTKSSNKTDRTEKVKNTYRGKETIDPISENKVTPSSNNIGKDEEPPSTSRRSPQVPGRVPFVTRRRELKVEEFTGSRVVPETYDTSGRIVRGRLSTDVGDHHYHPSEDQYYGDNEVDTYGTDSVSALSENDVDFMSRKENFEHARRRALDDAIEREDWELAAALSEGMKPMGDYALSHGQWTQSEMDKFISQNDWNAVSGVIAQMREGRKSRTSPPKHAYLPENLVIASPSSNFKSTDSSASPSILRAPSRGRRRDQHHVVKSMLKNPSLQKRIGSRSQLQHGEILSESSWTTESSYDSEYDSEYS